MHVVRTSIVGCLVLMAVTAGAAAPELRRDLDSYFLLASRRARLPDVTLESACNVGVNCARPVPDDGRCGRLVLGRGRFAVGAQAAGDEVRCTKPGLALWQLFRNAGTCGDATIQVTPPQTFAPPIIPGTCDAACVPDVAALQAACGFPEPFPSCDPGTPVTVRPGADCDGAADERPGNGDCDLAPGAYGAVRLDNDAQLTLDAGTYVMCGLTVGRRASVASTETTLAIPSSYDLRVGNGARVGFTCGLLRVLLAGDGAAALGRQTNVAARVCAPERRVRIGSGTTVSGRIVADEATTGRDIRAVCCCSDCPD